MKLGDVLYEPGPRCGMSHFPTTSIVSLLYGDGGIGFIRGDDFMLVADAGGPYVNVYAKGRHGWKGNHLPVSVVRVLDESTYRRGRFHPSEGGPKGIDIDHGMHVLAMTCAERGLAFFDLTRILEKRVIPLGWIGKSIQWRYEWIRDDLRRRRGWK